MADDSENIPTVQLDETCNPTGSLWHRWEPHIHMPGTLKNDNFTGDNVLDEYVRRLNETHPPIRAIGITDYYVLDSYERLLKLKNSGALPHVELLFPNIELRFAVNAGKGSPINLHLLISPEDPDHVEQTKRFLADIKFDYLGNDYGCTNAELIRLGRAFNENAENDAHALRLGVEQSKVTPRNLTTAFKNHLWARENILIALPASKNDGTGQMQDNGLMAYREQLERQAHIIFSGNKGDRDFWLGKKPSGTPEVLKEKYNGLKPCLHGCDAHDLEKVGNPDLDRYCWLKGDLTFETLRQACIEPEGRVSIGDAAPKTGLPSNTIRSLKASDADWFDCEEQLINPGLVAVIGPRGSGKTALIELLAAAAQSIDPNRAKGSFLYRARELTGEAESVVTWGVGDPTSSPLQFDRLHDGQKSSRARYLSQEFVDTLCSSDGLADELVSEIERVIFQAHPQDNRLDTSSFSELRDTMTQTTRRAKFRYQGTLADVARELSDERDLQRSVDQLEQKRKDEADSINRLKTDRKAMTPSKDTASLDRLEIIRAAAEAKSTVIARLQKRQLDLNGLKQEAEQFRDNDTEVRLFQLKAHYPDTGLTEEQWASFSLKYEGDIDAVLTLQITAVMDSIRSHQGPGKEEPAEVELEKRAAAAPYINQEIDLSTVTHSLLMKEQRRLEAKIGVNESQQKNISCCLISLLKQKPNSRNVTRK